MHLDKPILSVILPAYNAEKYIKQAINSILQQTFTEFELIIADDGSTDKTRQIINSYTDSRIIASHNESNQGKVQTVNRLVKITKGYYLTIHDADDYSHLARFQRQVDYLNSHPECVLLGTSFYNLVGTKRVKRIMPVEYVTILKNLRKKSQFHGPTMMFRKEVISSVGGLYRYFRNKEDVDFAMRVAEKYPATNLTEPLYFYRNIPNSLSKSGYNYLKFEGMKLLEILAQERERNGKDSLSYGIENLQFQKNLKKLGMPYIDDPALLHRKSAAHNLYFGFYKSAIRQSLLALKVRPTSLVNMKALFFCIKTAIWQKREK